MTELTLFLLLISSCLVVAVPHKLVGYFPRTIEMFKSQGCKGVYDSDKFIEVDRICEDCSNLFGRRYNIFEECRKDCFSTKVFPGCLDTLCFWEDEKKYKQWIVDLGGTPSAYWNHSDDSSAKHRSKRGRNCEAPSLST